MGFRESASYISECTYFVIANTRMIKFFGPFSPWPDFRDLGTLPASSSERNILNIKVE